MIKTERNDLALILARGESSRMGHPKGLCVAADDPRPLLRRIAEPYLERDGQVAVITTPDLVDSHVSVLDDPRVLWLVAAPGGGTARSVLLGVQSLAGRATHLWLHPVDLPRVGESVRADLMVQSRAVPDAVVVPMSGGTPGHPVVMPVREAWPADHPGAMRDLLHESRVARREIPCDDPGIVDDLDSPEDLSTQRGDD